MKSLRYQAESKKRVRVSHHPESGNPRTSKTGSHRQSLEPSGGPDSRPATVQKTRNSSLKHVSLARNVRLMSVTVSHSQALQQGGGHQSPHTRVLSGTAEPESSPMKLGLGQ